MKIKLITIPPLLRMIDWKLLFQSVTAEPENQRQLIVALEAGPQSAPRPIDWTADLLLGHTWGRAASSVTSFSAAAIIESMGRAKASHVLLLLPVFERHCTARHMTHFIHRRQRIRNEDARRAALIKSTSSNVAQTVFATCRMHSFIHSVM